VNERRTYDVPEVAEILGCSQRHVYELVAAGVIRKVPHMGRRVLIPRDAVDALLTTTNT
jgi:excisionase family DNA binding protein